jgi:CheY-specific phosphatase CheX
MEQQAIIDSVQSATMSVFSTMLGLEIEQGPVSQADKSPSVQDGVMSFAGLNGPWVGTGVIKCSASLACRLCEALLMTEAPSINEEVLDCVGEITNMIIGNFKTDAENILGPMSLSVPTVIYGRNFISRSLGGNEWLVIPFHCGGDAFEVQVCFRPASQSGNSRQNHSHLIGV